MCVCNIFVDPLLENQSKNLMQLKQNHVPVHCEINLALIVVLVTTVAAAVVGKEGPVVVQVMLVLVAQQLKQ